VKQNDQAPNAEFDEAMDHVNDMINNNIGGGSNYRMSAYNLPCGVVSVDSSTNNANSKKIYKMQYGDQTLCGYKYKSGQISFELENGIAFNNAGAVIKVTFTDYRVQVLATGNIIKLNGTVQVTNVGGGYIWQAITVPQTITHRIRGTINITYANDQVRERKYYQLRTWNSDATWAGLTLTIAGDTLTNVSEIGKTYEGDYPFQTEILTDLVWGNCGTTWAGPYKLLTGQARLNVEIPFVSPAYIEVEAGYNWDYSNSSSTPALVNNCESNAYKITTVILSSTTTAYQLY
jgi:hypothetical protein